MAVCRPSVARQMAARQIELGQPGGYGNNPATAYSTACASMRGNGQAWLPRWHGLVWPLFGPAFPRIFFKSVSFLGPASLQEHTHYNYACDFQMTVTCGQLIQLHIARRYMQQ